MGGASSGEAKGDHHHVAKVVPQVSHLGWGHWYTLRELEDSTNGFAHENVIGQGGMGLFTMVFCRMVLMLLSRICLTIGTFVFL